MEPPAIGEIEGARTEGAGRAEVFRLKKVRGWFAERVLVRIGVSDASAGAESGGEERAGVLASKGEVGRFGTVEMPKTACSRWRSC